MASTWTCVLPVMIVTVLTVTGYRVDCPTGYSLTENLRRCYRQTGLSYKSGHLLINILALVKFCRMPQRPEPMECVKEAWSPCNGQWTLEEWIKLTAELDIVKPGFTYLCSQDTDLEENAECVDSAKSEMEGCWLQAQHEADQLRDSLATIAGISEKQGIEIQKSFGEAVLSCSYRAALQFCNKKIANIIGNFIYSVYLDPYVSQS